LPVHEAVSIERIAEAAKVIDPVFLHSPQYECEPLSARLGVATVLKVECLNPIRSFKGRGTDYLMHRIEVPARGLVCASAGNFGQGMAYAARKRGHRVTVFAAVNASAIKVDRMRGLGAEVVLEGEDFDAAKEAARTHSEKVGALFVEDGAVAPIATAYNKFPVPMPSAFSGNVQPTGIVAGPDGNIWFTENNNFGGLARLTIDPLISLSPSPANFGTHLPGSTTNMSVVATNTTSNTYTIQGAPSVSGPNAGEFTVSGCASGVLGPNLPASPNTCTMTVQFKPTATGTRSATLSFTATDLTAIPPTPLTVKVLLTGTGQSLNPTFGPSNAAFGDGFVGAVSRPVNFSLTNVTGVPIQVGSATFGAPNPNDFRIVGDTCTGATVPDQSSCTLSVAFAPTTLGARSSNLTVTLASGTKLGPSSLSGNGVAAPPGSNPGSGYWEVASDGGIFNFGSAKFAGSTGSINLNKPIVGMARTSTGGGYWLVATDGGIFAFGDAKFKGSTGSIHLNKPIVGMAPTPDGQGYWLVASDGGIFAFNAPFLGSTGSINLNKPIVGMVATPDGQGYWMVATDGGIFSFGSAKFFGSTGATHLNQPIVGMATTPDGQGYWLAATDGGIFNFGDAKFFGSTGAIHLNKPVVGIAATPDGAGYWMSATDGGIFNFGDAKFFGSTGSIHLNKPMVGLAAAT